MLWVPVFLAELFVLALGCAFALSTIYVRLRDINFIWDILMQGLFYGSAVIYPLIRVAKESNVATHVLLLSPITQIIQDARHGLLPSQMPWASAYVGGNLAFAAIPFIIVLVIIGGGAWYFRARSPRFAEDI
jgi:ABC-type polysaccharide/polyol phosphate export permease